MPAGKHEIEFRFEPQSYAMGRKVTTFSQLLVVIVLLAGLWKGFVRKDAGTA